MHVCNSHWIWYTWWGLSRKSRKSIIIWLDSPGPTAAAAARALATTAMDGGGDPMTRES